MKNILIKKYFYFTLSLFIISCVTVNIYFPAAAVEKAADKIVDEVWGEEELKQKKEEKPQSFFKRSFRLSTISVGPNEAFAQEADINVTTPAIRKLKSSIKQRSNSIIPYLDRGNVGISNNGLLVIRNTRGLNLKEKAALNRLINAENRARETLYREIAKANNFPPERVSDIKKIFARSWIKRARKGWWIQSPAGAWIQKK